MKQGAPWALDLLGFGHVPTVTLGHQTIAPARPPIGGAVAIGFDLHNPTAEAQDVLVDLQVHYVKANGTRSAKVFKLRALKLAAGETAHLQKKLSLSQMTTRKHFAGRHAVDTLVNGQAFALGHFELADG